MLALALLPLPYGYYQLLRLVVCGSSAWIAWARYREQRWGWFAVFAVVALAYNPLFRVHLAREIWSVANLVTIGIFAADWLRHSRK